MIRIVKQVWSCVLSCLLVIAAGSYEVAGQQQTSAAGYSGQGAPLSTDELQQLVAPIALYPDALVAQILGGAAFPDQISEANNWLMLNNNLSGSALMQAVNAQPWEPSVKALTQFPSVLDNMAKNLSWTSALGEAYSTQTADVMSAVQMLRAKAYAAGNLKSGSQITVVQESPQVIMIQPANPQVVYVPVYNPAVVYGVTYVTPGYSAASVVATGMIAFGAGVAVGVAMSGGGCCGWSYNSWNCNWHGGTVVYANNTYHGNNAWHGGYYGSSATAYGPNGAAKVGNAYNPSTGTYARGAETVTPYGTQKAGQAYNPNTGAYAQTHQTSNASGSYGTSTYSKNGQTTTTQHESNAYGSASTMQSTNGAKAASGTTASGEHYAEGETSSGTKYAEQNGSVYKNTGSGWQQTQPKSNYEQSSSASRGWGQQEKSGGSSAYGGSGNGWQSRADSARGSWSRGGGGGWGGRR
jgi:hypothetical protein